MKARPRTAPRAGGALRERVRGYGIAVARVAIALGAGLLLQLLEQRREGGGRLACFLFAVAVTSWYAGTTCPWV